MSRQSVPGRFELRGSEPHLTTAEPPVASTRRRLEALQVTGSYGDSTRTTAKTALGARLGGLWRGSASVCSLSGFS